MERDHRLSKQGHVLIAHTNLVSNLKYNLLFPVRVSSYSTDTDIALPPSDVARSRIFN